MDRALVKIAAIVLAAGVAAASACRAGEAGSAPAEAYGFTGAGTDTVGAERSERDLNEIKKEMARIGGSEVPGQRQWERGKSPTVALLSSMALPGLGQLYNGRKWKTAIAVGVFTFYLGNAWLEQKKAQEYVTARDALPPNTIDWKNQDILYRFHKENARTYLWWSGAAWLITALDAWVDAHLYDVRAVKPTVVLGTGDARYVALSVEF